MKKNVLVIGVLSLSLFSCVSENSSSDQTVIVSAEEVLPLREVKDLTHFVNQIKSDSAWMVMMESKAKDRSVSIDEVINMDAKYLQDQDIEIVKVENDVIKNAEWMALVKQKSQEQGLSIDEVIRAEASFVFKQKQEALNSAQ